MLRGIIIKIYLAKIKNKHYYQLDLKEDNQQTINSNMRTQYKHRIRYNYKQIKYKV